MRKTLLWAIGVAIGAALSGMVTGAERWEEWDARVARVTRERTYRTISDLADFPQIREAFERAFSGDASVAPQLMSLVRHRDGAVAYTAAQLLGRFPSEAASSLLKETYATEERLTVRVQALGGLVRMGDPSAKTLAIAALSSEDQFTQAVGAWALEVLGDSANSLALLAYLDRQGDAIDSESLEILGVLGDSPGSTTVRDRLLVEAANKQRNFGVRLGAARGLAKMGLGNHTLVRHVLDLDLADATIQSLLVVKSKVSRLAASSNVRVKSQEEAEALLRDANLGHHRLDGWGRSFRVKFVSEGVFHVVSDGPDMTPNTDDDMSSTEPFGAYQRRVFGDLF